MQFMNVEIVSFWKTNVDFPKPGGLGIQKLHSKSIYLIKLLRWPFFISPMGSFQRGRQIFKDWYGGQLDASLDSGSGTGNIPGLP